MEQEDIRQVLPPERLDVRRTLHPEEWLNWQEYNEFMNEVKTLLTSAVKVQYGTRFATKDLTEEIVISLRSIDGRISRCDAPAAASLSEAFETALKKIFAKHFTPVLNDVERELEDASRPENAAQNLFGGLI